MTDVGMGEKSEGMGNQRLEVISHGRLCGLHAEMGGRP